MILRKNDTPGKPIVIYIASWRVISCGMQTRIGLTSDIVL